MDTMAHAAHGDEEAHEIPHGWRRFLYSTNHKDIGTMYLVFALIAGMIGGALSIAIRAELMYPGLQIFHDTHTFDVFVTAHGLIMIFFMISGSPSSASIWCSSRSISSGLPICRAAMSITPTRSPGGISFPRSARTFPASAC